MTVPITTTTTTTPTTTTSPLRKLQHYFVPPNDFYTILAVLVVFDIILSMVILKLIPYTEIDWIAYMQEVGGFIAGERDYTKLRGDTGPLVYPAGFVYIYSVLFWVTDNGKNIFLAQCLFAALYIITNIISTLVFYSSGLVSLWVLPIMYISKRLHSIYMLRCFNDCVAMGLMYVAMYFMMKNRWSSGTAMVSFALSVKMNILLFVPGLGIVLLLRFPRKWFELFKHAAIVIGIQALLGIPFLVEYPYEYLSKSFEFGRVFTYIWTVNWKFLSEDVFVGPLLSKTMLITHLSLLLITFVYLDGATICGLWFRNQDGANTPQPSTTTILTVGKTNHQSSQPSAHGPKQPTSYSIVADNDPSDEITIGNDVIASRLVISNFIGVVCAKSLHYQFYSWYAHQLPLVLSLVCGLTMNHVTDLWIRSDRGQAKGGGNQTESNSTNHVFNWSLFPKISVAYITFALIELTWNVFPSTPKSSLLWQIVHWSCLLTLLLFRLVEIRSTTTTQSALTITKIKANKQE